MLCLWQCIKIYMLSEKSENEIWIWFVTFLFTVFGKLFIFNVPENQLNALPVSIFFLDFVRKSSVCCSHTWIAKRFPSLEVVKFRFKLDTWDMKTILSSHLIHGGISILQRGPYDPILLDLRYFNDPFIKPSTKHLVFPKFGFQPFYWKGKNFHAPSSWCFSVSWTCGITELLINYLSL